MSRRYLLSPTSLACYICDKWRSIKFTALLSTQQYLWKTYILSTQHIFQRRDVTTTMWYGIGSPTIITCYDMHNIIHIMTFLYQLFASKMDCNTRAVSDSSFSCTHFTVQSVCWFYSVFQWSYVLLCSLIKETVDSWQAIENPAAVTMWLSDDKKKNIY